MVSMIVIGTGLFFVLSGLYILTKPKLQGFRDINVIRSEEVSAPEQYIGYIIGIILVGSGIGIIYLGL